jgi:hypothetical protein
MARVNENESQELVVRWFDLTSMADRVTPPAVLLDGRGQPPERKFAPKSSVIRFLPPVHWADEVAKRFTLE